MEAAHDVNTVKVQILDAADERFRQYGYNKTTMAEIAKDCGMSAANLYRYFENKQDICCGLATRCLREDEDALQKVSESNLEPQDKVMAFIRSTFEHTYKQWSETPRIDEMVQVVTSERPEYVHRHLERKREILVRILKEGAEKGVFHVDDFETSAESVLIAIVAFDVPFFLHLFSLEDLQRRVTELGKLLLKGLNKR